MEEVRLGKEEPPGPGEVTDDERNGIGRLVGCPKVEEIGKISIEGQGRASFG